MGFSSANVAVTTAVAGQVNLVVNGGGAPTQFWDGSNAVNDLTVHGGNGTWTNFATNFTNVLGTVNEGWQNGIAIFTATPGTVTLGSDILYQGMVFSSDGYTVMGAGAFALHPTGIATITTDAGVTATIDAPIVGVGGLNKAGPGILVLTVDNTYGGGTMVSGGTLKVGSDTNLGDPSGSLTLEGGELQTTADFTSARTVVLIPLNGANTLAAVTGTSATYTGVVSGTSVLTVGDSGNRGTVVLTNLNNSYSGGTNVLPGTLVAAGNGALGTGPVQILNGTLMIPAGVTLPNEVTFVEGGVLNNAGTLNNKAGSRFRTAAASASFADAWNSPSAAMILARRSRSASACAAIARCISCGRSTCLTWTCVTLTPQASVCSSRIVCSRAFSFSRCESRSSSSTSPSTERRPVWAACSTA